MNYANCFKMSAGWCRTTSSSSPVSLLTLLEQRDLPAFKDALQTIDPNTWWGYPHYASILDLACEKDGASDFVQALLEANADPNKVNTFKYKAPIHFAADSANLGALEVLLYNRKTDINITDDFGNTALHRLAKLPFSTSVEECIKCLLQRTELQVNKTNRRLQTAVYLAARRVEKETVKLLLESGRVSVDDETCDGMKTRDIILKEMRDLVLLLPEIGGGEKNEDAVSRLFSCLYKADEIMFSETLDECLIYDEEKKLLNCHHGKFTLLQYAVNFGLIDAGRILLEKGADPNATAPYKERLPSILAADGGYNSILHLLIEKGAEFTPQTDGQTVLHIVINQARYREYKLTDYRCCFDLILDKLVMCGMLNINATDWHGNTALHIAARNCDRYFILKLMEHGAYIGTLNNYGESPLEHMSSGILEEFLNKCVTTNDKSPLHPKYEIRFDCKFLSPPASVHGEQPGSVSLPMDDAPTKPVPICQPLLYISHIPNLRPLLKHPIITSFVELKWRGCEPYFYINLTFYLLFVALMTIYILIVYEYSAESYMSPSTNYTTESNISRLEESGISENKTDFRGQGESYQSPCVWSPGGAIWTLLVFHFLCLFIREFFQIVVSPLHYVKSPENYLELLLILSSGLVLFYRCADSTTRPQLSATTILISWAELVLLIGRHPKLSTNIEVLKTVSMNFLQFLTWYSLLIIAFALSFYTLFRRSAENDNFFLEPGTSVFKTVVMVTGEFDVGNIPFHYFPVTSHIVFVLFVFFVAIVLYNLLNGLAVSDIQAIKDDAELVGLVSRIKFVSCAESVLLGHHYWYHPKSELEGRFCQGFNCIWYLFFSSLPVRVKNFLLFPGIIPSPKIRVLPNQLSQILTSSLEDKPAGNNNHECYQRCLFYGNYSLDNHIVKDAINLLTEEWHSPEAKRTRVLLKDDSTENTTERNSCDIRYLKEMVSSVKVSCYETQKSVEEILRIMKKS